MIDAARRLAAELEATVYGARLGLRAGEMLSDAVTASVPYRPEFANAQGYVHGGVAASLSVWSAMLVAVASDRDHAACTRPISLSVSYLASAREEALHATARVASRGRDIVHVEVEVASDRGRPVAAALAVLRTLRAQPRPLARPASSPVASCTEARRPLSPFSRSMGIETRTHEPASVTMVMRHDINQGLAGAIDPGALVALADTCAALACLPALDERISGSATLSLSAVFGDPLLVPAVAMGRAVAEDAGVRSALVEVGGDGAPTGAAHAAMTACVAYRFVAAEERW